jgi:hypothetical protein
LKQIRSRLTYANVMSSIAVFLVLGGATAFAASHLARNSVGSAQLKRNAVTAAKIKRNAVTAAKIKNGTITGAKVNTSTLGTVPSATTASSLAGQTPFFVRLGFGGSQTLATNGAVSLVATCSQEGGEDIAQILEQTSVDGAAASSDSPFSGAPGATLDVATIPANRIFAIERVPAGVTAVSANIDLGWVLGPEGKMLTTNSEGIALGLNYHATGCLFGGIINAVG